MFVNLPDRLALFLTYCNRQFTIQTPSTNMRGFWGNLMEGFESYLLLKGLSPTTIRDTLCRAKKFVSQIGEFTQENVTAYILKQKHDGRLNNGINVDIKAIKHYLKYLKLDTKIACFLLPDNRSDREILSDGEIAEFMAVKSQIGGILDWGVYWLLTIYCGLRCGETSRLQVGDIDFGSKVINLRCAY